MYLCFAMKMFYCYNCVFKYLNCKYYVFEFFVTLFCYRLFYGLFVLFVLKVSSVETRLMV